LYTICWNEAYMRTFFFRYYNELVDRYIFLDDGFIGVTIISHSKDSEPVYFKIYNTIGQQISGLIA